MNCYEKKITTLDTGDSRSCLCQPFHHWHKFLMDITTGSKVRRTERLKTAIYNLVKDAKVLGYGSGKGKTWWGFWDTDRDERGYFIDRYSAEKEWVKSTSQGAVGAGMNIEHSFPERAGGVVPLAKLIKTSTTSCHARKQILIPQKAIIRWVPL